MDITPLIRDGQQVIGTYSNGFFKVNGKTYNSAILVTSEKTDIWDIGEITDVSELKVQHFSVFIEQSQDIDVVLLGSGKDMAFISPELKSELKSLGLNIDIMPTGAACRTYNVLMAEGRRVVCSLLPV